MQVDAIAVRLRRRSNMEAADLGVSLCQGAARSIYVCFLAVALPVTAIALALFEIATWLPLLVLWWLKPWLDRTILFVLSRAAFGQATSLRDLWHAQGEVFWRHLLGTLTLRRLSPWRSFTQAVYQLEGLGFRTRGRRLRQMRLGKTGTALLITTAYSFIEISLVSALVSLVFWFAPPGTSPQSVLFFTNAGEQYLLLAIAAAYALVLLLIEPFYVAAGFALYLNRRVELEAWDIEQEFRRAFRD